MIFDPAQISYGKILQVFFSVALDPTMKDAQGPDEGTQYRSEIFYGNPEQKRVAQAYVAQLDADHAFGAPIATRVDALSGFLSGRGVSSGFPGVPSGLSVHRGERHAEGGCVEAAVAGGLRSAAGAVRQGRVLGLAAATNDRGGRGAS